MTVANTATGQKVFGSGYFYAVPTTANPTPTQFLVTQDVTVDFKRELKYLYGSDGQVAIDVATGKLTIAGKVQNGQVNIRAFNDLLFGTSTTSTAYNYARNEAGTIPTTPYQVTVANSATWVTDLGVTWAAGAAKQFQPLIRVASGPTTGQYSVSAGVYTFAAADTGIAVNLSYTYTSATSGQSISITNQPMGKTGNFQAIVGLLWGSEKSFIQLNNCMSGGISLATKLDDYTMPAFDYGAAADSSNIIGTISTAETS